MCRSWPSGQETVPSQRQKYRMGLCGQVSKKGFIMQAISLVLYMVLGVLLAVAGVNIIDRPIMFLAIMGTVLAIDALGRS